MTFLKSRVFLVVLTFLWTSNRGDSEVCLLKESCILLCSFQPGDEVVIHWTKTPRNTPVYSYYHNQDQLSRQDQQFKGRTSLFQKEIPGGNASLRMTGMKVQDQGRYQCYTSTITHNQETLIDLNVEAPVGEVNIQHTENRITCSSGGNYPKPELTWSNQTASDQPTVQQDEQQLYSISSSLSVSDSAMDPVYRCTVSAGRNKRRASWFKPTSISSSNSKTIISCAAADASPTVVVWRFNHSQVITSRSKGTSTVSAGWRQHLTDVTESGELMLKDLSSNQEGLYSCELSTDEETYITNTFLRVETTTASPHAEGLTPGAIAGIVVGAILIGLTIAGVVFYKKCKQKERNNSRDGEVGKALSGEYGDTVKLQKGFVDEET